VRKTNCKTNYELEDERQMKVKNSTPRRKRTVPKLAFNAAFFSFFSFFHSFLGTRNTWNYVRAKLEQVACKRRAAFSMSL